MSIDRIKMVQELSRRPGVLIRFNTDIGWTNMSRKPIPAGVLFLHVLAGDRQITINDRPPYTGYTRRAIHTPLSESILLHLLHDCTIIRVYTTLDEFEVVEGMVPEN